MDPRTPRGTSGPPRLALGADERLEERIRALVEEHYDLCVGHPAGCDLRLIGPRELEKEGHQVLRRHRLREPHVPTLVIVPYNAAIAAVRACFRDGAADVLEYGELDQGLTRAIEHALQAAIGGRAREVEGERMAESLGQRARDVEAALHRLRTSYDETLTALVGALDARERETGCHSQRVALYSVLLGLRLGLGEEGLQTLYRGALLHDIGKIGIPDAILLKPAQFTPDEWTIMRTHAQIGADIVSRIGFLAESSDVPRAHHEAWDGSGYPRGLLGDDIPFYARVFAVVDSYDAIRSTRPYKEAKSHGWAVNRLGEVSGARLDPSLVDVFNAEPESTWIELQRVLSGGVTFVAGLDACRGVRAQ